MKKSIVVLLLLQSLFFSPLALAQGQPRTYSTFDRLIDNVKMIFTFGEKKVILALNIREKELDSALVHTETGNIKEAEKNLEGAKERLQYVQTKVSKDTAENVKTSTMGMINKIKDEENLPSRFQTYILEEEKTQLTAELIEEVEKSEGQKLIREIVKDGQNGNDRVDITIEGNNIQTDVMEIETRINQIDTQIVAKTVEDAENQIDTPSKTKDREDVKPTPNVIDNEVDNTFVGPDGPGPGIVDDD